MMVHSGSVSAGVFVFIFLENRCLCLIVVGYQTQSLVVQRSSASFLANCTPLVTLSRQSERTYKIKQGGS